MQEAPAVDRKKAGLDLMYGEIRRELDLGYLPGEICVLVRGNTLGGEIIEYLMDRLTADEKYSWVKVISDDAMAIEKSPAVRLLVSKLRFMADSVVAEATEGLTDSVSSRIMRLSNNYEHLSASGLEPSEALAEARPYGPLSSPLACGAHDSQVYRRRYGRRPEHVYLGFR